MIEDVTHYIKSPSRSDLESVQKSVLSQFGPDYCVISASGAFYLFTTAFILDNSNAKPLPTKYGRLIGKLLGSEAKSALIGAGFDELDAGKMVPAIIKAGLAEASKKDD